jgi:hypothetical protein
MTSTEAVTSPTPEPMPAPKPKKRRWPWIVGGAVALFLAIGAANGGNSAPATAAAPTAPAPAYTAPAYTYAAPAPTYSAPAYTAPTPAYTAPATSGHVVYEVTGAKSAANITYMTGKNMSMAQVSTAKLPWRKEVQVSDDSTFFVPTLTVQNAGSGTITCRITVDGAVVDEVSSQGAYAMAMCTGSTIN